ncbi:F0F1 ATP synthase subunit beta, partial [Paeniclostridium sordellii]|nr:F0F1 ATP synthase subunit beta [Paeniclostridium sordellii]
MANLGKIVQVIGPVVDLKFNDEKSLPNLLNALEIKHGDKKIVIEVAQHVGDDTVRCVSTTSIPLTSPSVELIDIHLT